MRTGSVVLPMGGNEGGAVNGGGGGNDELGVEE